MENNVKRWETMGNHGLSSQIWADLWGFSLSTRNTDLGFNMFQRVNPSTIFQHFFWPSYQPKKGSRSWTWLDELGSIESFDEINMWKCPPGHAEESTKNWPHHRGNKRGKSSKAMAVSLWKSGICCMWKLGSSQWDLTMKNDGVLSGGWYTTPLKNMKICQLEWLLFPIYGQITQFPNHQLE